MKEYVTTREDLRRVAIGSLGPMTEDTHAGFTAKAKVLGEEHGVERPVLVLDLKFKPGAHDMGLIEYPYPVAPEEWQAILDTLYMADGVPEVCVADGEKWAFQI